MKTKVLFISNEIQTGGATKSLLGLVKTLKDHYNIEPIVLVNNNGLLKKINSYNITCFKIKYKPFSIGGGSTGIRKIIKRVLIPLYYVRHLISNYLALKKIKKIIDLNTIKIIHTNTNRDDFGAMISKKYNIPHVWHLREFGKLDYNCIYLRKNWIKYMDRNTTKFIAISNSIKDYFVKKKLTENKINVIYNGVINNIIPKNYNKCDDIIKIIVVGAITHEKGQIQVIEALSKINKKEVELFLYGECNNDYKKALNNRIKDLNLSDKVHFMGYVNNVESELQKNDIAITPSKSEAFGRVTVEYMFAKLPVIVSNTGANSEIVKETGLIYEYGNIDDLTNCINKLCDSKDLRYKYGCLGYKNANENFTAELNAKNIYNLYENIMKKM